MKGFYCDTVFKCKRLSDEGLGGTNKMKNRLLFTFLLAVLTDTGEGSLPSRSMSTLDLAVMAILGVSPTDAASWGEVQAQRLLKLLMIFNNCQAHSFRFKTAVQKVSGKKIAN